LSELEVAFRDATVNGYEEASRVQMGDTSTKILTALFDKSIKKRR
jgi:hypothetical protein